MVPWITYRVLRPEVTHLGEVVFTLVETGLLMSQPGDSKDDFIDAFDFASFDRDYRWTAIPTA